MSLEEMYNELFGPDHNVVNMNNKHKRLLKNLFVKCLEVEEVQ